MITSKLTFKKNENTWINKFYNKSTEKPIGPTPVGTTAKASKILNLVSESQPSLVVG
jgi:hypothetical protein